MHQPPAQVWTGIQDLQNVRRELELQMLAEPLLQLSKQPRIERDNEIDSESLSGGASSRADDDPALSDGDASREDDDPALSDSNAFSRAEEISLDSAGLVSQLQQEVALFGVKTATLLWKITKTHELSAYQQIRSGKL